MPDIQYDLALVGTGFASTFFLQTYLRAAPEDARVVVLERGGINNSLPGKAYLQNQGIPFEDIHVNKNPSKAWLQRIGFGGGTCWTGNTPRMHPSDFRTKSVHGVGEDWPITYDDLEPYYVIVEEVMGISGEANGQYPRSKPYPLPPHRLNALDREFARRYPDLYMAMPSARASSPGAGRAVCCANGVCAACPVAAKFQVDFHLRSVYEDSRVELVLGANVTHLDIAAGTVKGVTYIKAGTEQSIRCDIAAVGAHGIMTPFILLKSGLRDPALGKYLNEQVSVSVDVLLDGVQNYDGSSIITGLGLMGIDGRFRGNRPGFILENWNLPWLRAEPERWRERGFFKLVFEDLPQERNHVTVSREDPGKPEVHYFDNSDYTKRALHDADRIVSDLLNGMPIESFNIEKRESLGGEAHIQGTSRMGTDPATSVVDTKLVHHKVRNLLALGSCVFPTCPAANPTLTLSALACMAADRLF